MYRSLSGVPRDVALLVARLLIVIVMMSHVLQTLGQGLSATAMVFAKFGIPLAIAAAAFTIVVELVASVAFLLGLRIAVPAAFLVFVMAGAIFFVHAKHGVFVTNGGWELVGMIIAGSLGLMVAGPGRFSLDHVLDLASERRARTGKVVHQPVTV